MNRLPRLALTMGDVAGVGPETIAKALSTDASRLEQSQIVVVGCPDVLSRALRLVGSDWSVEAVAGPDGKASRQSVIACWNPATTDVRSVSVGRVDARAGAAAFEWLISATDAARSGAVDGIVTAPLSKAALHLAGHHYPGHTEILAERCGVTDFAMLLYLPARSATDPGGLTKDLAVAHATLHTSIASVPGLLTTDRVRESIALLHHFFRRIGNPQPRLGVCALNPHAGEAGLFGDEEIRLIAPAVSASRDTGIDATGPFPADTLLLQATEGAFDGVVAMYHDQGHIALKLLGFHRAVNITLGLPIIRTSPSQGTAFDIAGKNLAKADGLLAAIEVARRLTLDHRR